MIYGQIESYSQLDTELYEMGQREYKETMSKCQDKLEHLRDCLDDCPDDERAAIQEEIDVLLDWVEMFQKYTK